MDAGALEFGSSSAAVPGTLTESWIASLEAMILEPAPAWDADTAGGGFTYHATVLSSVVILSETEDHDSERTRNLPLTEKKRI